MCAIRPSRSSCAGPVGTADRRCLAELRQMLRERADLAALAAMPAARRHDELARVLDYLLAAQGIAVGGARRRTLVRELADWLGGHGEHGDDAAAAVAPAPTFDVRGTGTGRAKWSPP